LLVRQAIFAAPGAGGSGKKFVDPTAIDGLPSAQEADGPPDQLSHGNSFSIRHFI
jgi:hypothetical protein